MSLDWNTKKCADSKALRADTPTGWPLTNYLIWALGALGIGTVTEKNWKEVYARLAIINALDGDEAKLTPSQVRDRIGLETNWTFTEETRRKWTFRILDRHLNEQTQRAAKAVS